MATDSAASSTSNLSSATETATEKLNAIKDKYTQAIDYINNQLDAEIDKIKEEEDAAVDAVEAQIDALKDQQDAEDEYYQNKIDALNDANDALQDQIELEQYEEALAEAKSKKIKVLQNGSFTYSEDVDAVSKAQTDLANYNNKQAIQNQIDELENPYLPTLSRISLYILLYWENGTVTTCSNSSAYAISVLFCGMNRT